MVYQTKRQKITNILSRLFNSAPHEYIDYKFFLSSLAIEHGFSEEEIERVVNSFITTEVIKISSGKIISLKAEENYKKGLKEKEKINSEADEILKSSVNSN